MKLVALAGLQMIMSLGSSDTPAGETIQQKSFQREIGSGDSYSNIGVMYVNGASAERDEVAAGELYQKACNLNSA